MGLREWMRRPFGQWPEPSLALASTEQNLPHAAHAVGIGRGGEEEEDDDEEEEIMGIIIAACASLRLLLFTARA